MIYEKVKVRTISQYPQGRKNRIFRIPESQSDIDLELKRFL